MKKIFFLTLFILLTATLSFSAGTLTIDRIWSSGGTGHVLLTYANDSEKTFKKHVKIKCIAIDPDGNKINISTGTISTADVGPIEPGFEDTVKISVDLLGMKMKSMRCSCREQ